MRLRVNTLCLFFLMCASSVFANWTISNLENSIFYKLSITRNVLTVYYPTQLTTEANIQLNGISGVEVIYKQDTNHTHIEHYGYEEDSLIGHSHFSVANVNFLGWQDLNNYLTFLEFSNDESKEIIKQYRAYLVQQGWNALSSQIPLRPNSLLME